MLASRTIPKHGSRYKCAVLGCTSNSFDNLNVSFHKLPAPNKRLVFTTDYFGNRIQIDQLTAWIKALKVPETLRHNHFKICSLHFKKEDFFLPDYPTKSPTLLPTAVPSVNLPGSKPEKIAKNEIRLKRRLNRREKIDHSSFDSARKKGSKAQEKARITLNQVPDNIGDVPEKVTDLTPKVVDDLNCSEPVDGGVIVEAFETPDSDTVVEFVYRGEVNDKGVMLDHSYCARPPSPHSPPNSSCERDGTEATDPATGMAMEVPLILRSLCLMPQSSLIKNYPHTSLNNVMHRWRRKENEY